MKKLLPLFLFVALGATLLLGGCAYDGGGSNFTQHDLEIQRHQLDRARGGG